MFYFSLVKGLAHGLLSSESPQCRVLCCIVPKAAFQLLEYWKIIGDPGEKEKGIREVRGSVWLRQPLLVKTKKEATWLAAAHSQQKSSASTLLQMRRTNKALCFFDRFLPIWLPVLLRSPNFERWLIFLFENYKGWSCDTVKSKFFISSNNLFLSFENMQKMMTFNLIE